MIGMIQILTYMIGFYMVLKGIEILQIAICAPTRRAGPIVWGVAVLFVCVISAIGFTMQQDTQARSASSQGRPF